MPSCFQLSLFKVTNRGSKKILTNRQQIACRLDFSVKLQTETSIKIWRCGIQTDDLNSTTIKASAVTLQSQELLQILDYLTFDYFLFLLFLPLILSPVMVQSKHHTLQRVHETCRQPVKCRRHNINRVAFVCGFRQQNEPFLILTQRP